MKNSIVKIANKDIEKELNSIRFDSSYLTDVINKYKGDTYKIFDLKPYEANILKQLCLSLGFDCAVHRDAITCKCEKTDAIIFASNSQLIKLCDKLKNQPFGLKELAKNIENIINFKLKSLKIRNTIFDFSRQYIMGILNVTPDSFSDGGNYTNPQKALKHALEMINDGADIIDIGGESTRPNSQPVTVEEEISRVIPVIELIRKENINIPISIDTRNYETAKLAIERGADIINDVTGLDYDENLFEYVTENNIPTVIMHSNQIPAISEDFSDKDIIEQVYISLNNKINKLTENGLSKENIIIDVGIGFGKSPQSNFELLKRMREFTSLQVPILLGISRKSFIRNTFNIDIEQSDVPTALYSAKVEGVNFHRVHNVKLVKQYLDYIKFIK